MTKPAEELTPEQQAIIQSSARLVVVGACPGSGKTRVFVESLRQRLSKYEGQRARGFAALSFTNVAQEEISKRLGGTPGHPHFVGTLDAFMLRFVVRPFGHLLGVSADGIELIPSPLNEQIEIPSIKYGSEAYERVSIFRAHACGGTIEAPVFSFRDPISRKEMTLQGELAAYMLRMKWAQWKKRGRITHSDCQYLAAAILTHPEHGPTVRDLICRRFPEILIDEFQDTGWFLSLAILNILRHPKVCGLVVGDPNQAIYEFSGSNPNLFTETKAIAGAEFLPLSISHRCPQRVVTIANALTASEALLSAREAAPPGRAVLMVHDLESPQLSEQLVSRIAKIHAQGDQLAILARRRPVVGRLAGAGVDSLGKGGGISRRIDRAVSNLHSGEAAVAGRIISGVLGQLLLNEPAPSIDELRQLGIERRAWRLAQYSVLIEASRIFDGELWNDWLVRCKEAVRGAGIKLGCTLDNRSLGSTFKATKDGNRPRVVRTPEQAELSPGNAFRRLAPRLDTVHQVKGAEFDTVILFVPKPHGKHAPCPSDEWWPASANFEERRIAFVAASRARKTFVLCVHRETHQRLKKKRESFLSLFDETIDLKLDDQRGPTGAVATRYGYCTTPQHNRRPHYSRVVAHYLLSPHQIRDV